MPKGKYIINHNGKMVDGNKPAIPAGNRALRYGDSLFESICFRNGRMPLLPWHFRRLQKSAEILKMQMPAAKWNEEFFHSQITALAEESGLQKEARIRLTIYRSGGGLYAPEKNTAEFLIEASPLPGHAYSADSPGLHVSIFTEHVKTPSKLSSLKSGNALISVLGSIAAKEKERDDMLLMNDGGNIIEATGSNIFYFHEGKWFTPPVSDGCVDGVLRRYILDNSESLELEVVEHSTTILHLAEADEIFLSNATLGIRPVRMLKSKEYGAEKTKEMAGKLEKIVTL